MALFGLFGKPKAGGIKDEIRCDEPSYLIWKWHPAGSQLGNNNRENAIRWGSSLRVKDGEVAVFVYNQANGLMQDFIEGPFDQKIDTENLPILASIIGCVYNGGTPFQAEVYFINLAKVIQIPFAVPYFDVFDPRYNDFGVPTAVRGQLTFNIEDYKNFIKLHRLVHFDLNDFQKQVKDAITRYIKSVVANIPIDKNIPVVQLERAISTINEIVEDNIRDRFERDYGVNVKSIDINTIEIDKSSEGYQKLLQVTQELVAATAQAQTQVNIKNLHDMQRINSENMEETLRFQREETQYAQRKQTQMTHYVAYQLEQQAEVGIAAAEALSHMGSNCASEIPGSGSLNTASIMTGMAMGGAIGQNMANILNDMMQGVNSTQAPKTSPPPIPNCIYHVVQKGQATGPFDIGMLSQMVSSGLLTKETLVWKDGLEEWVRAERVQELRPLFCLVESSVQSVPTEPHQE